MGTRVKPGKFDCFNKLHPNEPFFVLRGNDKFAPRLIAAWADAAEQAGCRMEKVQEARQIGQDMLAWQRAQGTGKNPD